MYTNEDARFDDEALNGLRCPRHGRTPCSCCLDRDDDEHDPAHEQELGRRMHARGYSRDMCENSDQTFGWDRADGQA
jgi:hypothetical protein